MEPAYSDAAFTGNGVVELLSPANLTVYCRVLTLTIDIDETRNESEVFYL